MKRKRWTVAILALVAMGLSVQAQIIEHWDFNGNGQFQFSDNGTSLGGIYDTNFNLTAQTPDDGLFVLHRSANVASYVFLPEEIDLTAGLCRATLAYDSIDFSSGTAQQNAYCIALRPAPGNYFMAKIWDADKGGILEVRMEFYLPGYPGASRYGSVDIPGLTNDTAGAGTISLELDFTNSQARIYAGETQLLHTAAIDFAAFGITNIVELSTHYLGVEIDDTVVLDDLLLEGTAYIPPPPPPNIIGVVDEWDMNDNGQFQWSYQDGVNTNSLGPYADANLQHVVQVADDGTFNWSRDGWAGSFDLSGPPIDLTASDRFSIETTWASMDMTASPAAITLMRVESSNGGRFGYQITGTTNGQIVLVLENNLGDGINAALPAGIGVHPVIIDGLVSTEPVTITVVADPVHDEIRWTVESEEGTSTTTLSADVSVVMPDVKSIAAWSSSDTGSYVGWAGNLLVWDHLRLSVLAPISPYEKWVADHSLAPEDAGYEDDTSDSDGYNNLHEFALGGDPTNALSTGKHVCALGADGNLYYIHAIRQDADAAGLTYTLTTDNDLVSPPGWTNAYYEVVGTNTAYGIAGYDEVTNRISTAADDARFLKLQIEITE